MPSTHTATNKIKVFIVAFFIALAVGTIAGLIARLAVAPIVGVFHNRWWEVISQESAKHAFHWVGQVVGTLTFVGYLYSDLIGKNWSKFNSIVAVCVAIIFLLALGVLLASIVGMLLSS